MRRFLRLGLGAACAFAVAGGVLSGAATAAGNPPTFTVAVLPGSLTVDKSGVVQGTFKNNGPAVSGVAFTFTFPFSVSVPAANGCASVHLFPKTVACLVGLVGPGQTASKAFQFTVPNVTGPLTVNGVAGWLSPLPPRAGLVKASGTATIYEPGSLVIPTPAGSTDLAAASDCVGQGGNVASTFNTSFDGNPGTEGLSVTAGLNSVGLPCTPIIAGVVTFVGGYDLLAVKLPLLQQPATVVLTFGDEQLPWPSYENPPPGRDLDAPNNLYEYPNYPDISSSPLMVPACVAGALPVSPGADYSTDACIVSIDGSSDPDGDYDAGTITLLVQGSGTGDGAFHGG